MSNAGGQPPSSSRTQWATRSTGPRQPLRGAHLGGDRAGVIAAVVLLCLAATLLLSCGMAPSPATIHAGARTPGATLCAVDQLDFVPLPPSLYGTEATPGPRTARLGEPLPTQEQPLFGADQVLVVMPTSDPFGAPRAATITLTDKASRALASFSTTHLGEYVAVVVDGRVGDLFSFQGPYTSSTVTLQDDPAQRLLCP